MSEKITEEEILELIRLVDRNFKFTPFDLFFRGDNAFPSVALIVFFILIGVSVVTAPFYEGIVVAISFLAFTVAFFLFWHVLVRST